MTPFEKLVWLQTHACSVSVEINNHRGSYDTVEDVFSDEGATDLGALTTPDDVKAECIRRNTVVVVDCYPSTPVGFVRIWHWDLETAINDLYEAAHETIERNIREGFKGPWERKS